MDFHSIFLPTLSSMLFGAESFSILLSDPWQAGCVFCPSKPQKVEQLKRKLSKDDFTATYTWLYSLQTRIKPNKIKLEITIHKDLLMSPRNICRPKLWCTWWLCSVQLLLLGVLRWLKTSQENYEFQNISPGSLIPYPSDLYHMRYGSLLFASTRKLAKTGSANSSILWTFTCLALFYFY